MSRQNLPWLVVILPLLAAIPLFFLAFQPNRSTESPFSFLKLLGQNIRPFIQSGSYPDSIEFSDRDHVRVETQIKYTIHTNLQDYMTKLLKRYDPDYAAFVAIDAQTGEILTLANHVKDQTDPLADQNIAIQSNFPAASVFKIVTAASAIDRRILSADSVIPFNGRQSTLYRTNVNSQKRNRWTRYPSLKDAFARSINTVFGKIGAFYVGPSILEEYSSRFRFNQTLADPFLPIESSHLRIDHENQWSTVEVASGFNRETKISPLHGAMIAGTIGNNGIMMKPILVDEVQIDSDLKKTFRSSPIILANPIDGLAASEMKTLMKETVHSGTTRRIFRPFLRSRKYQSISVGGKSGSLTSRDPRGKCDWFVGYAEIDGKVLSFAALTVHKKYWRVKSAYLVKEYLKEFEKKNSVELLETRIPLASR